MLLTTRAAVIFGLGISVSATAVALKRTEGKSWPSSLMYGGATFGAVVVFANSVIS
ncbi:MULTISPECIES: hypothetical protein [Streptosporangium]|jgi:hypothetical protein|uniref:Uncharacterized protein n=2 Tax=Streptosporangium TaxID=2000 RepID=A0A239CAH9_9ACTN|nr:MULTISPECIES: hypothetical protein [Streptosporangium]MDP9841202.1 hypothetical protein [Streptosporangium lutulentum]SNS16969.1 hypothetical protein SAMN05216276_100584 [Streptosporangium subroseum]